MSKRREFSPSVMMAAWERCAGRCEKCTAKLFPGKFQYDHIQPDGLGGEPTLGNCQVLCSACHSEKTHRHDRPLMTKADNIKKRHLGIRKSSRPMPGSKASGIRKRMNGTVERW